ncbi:MAG: alanine:cation symporter family protein, partial [Rickettsiales bacterium]|nr:alanine:cation symporter family protein [Rickettsiales bacterium]
ALIAGFKRSAFSNEAGLGSSPIAHSAAKTNEPVKEGCVALLEPFMDTIIICTLTGLVITITGVYNTDDESVSGILLTSQAFGSVISLFPSILTVAVTLFAFSTMLSWSYYGERAWTYLFGHRSVMIFYLIFCIATFVGGVTQLSTVIDLSDLLLLSMSLPNLIGLYLLSPMISRELSVYVKRLKNNELPIYDHYGNRLESVQQ